MRERRSRTRHKSTRIIGAFAARPIEMLRSPAFGALSLAAHKVMARLEIELAQHGGKDNGRLPCTYAHFREYGIHTNMIAPAIRELVALGFVEITRHGVAGNADFRQPALYRLTYRHVDGGPGDGTHEWKRIANVKDAEQIAKDARGRVDKRAVERGRKTKSRPQKLGSAPPSESEVDNEKVPTSESEVTAPTSESEVTSIILPAGPPLRHSAKRRAEPPQRATRRQRPA